MIALYIFVPIFFLIILMLFLVLKILPNNHGKNLDTSSEHGIDCSSEILDMVSESNSEPPYDEFVEFICNHAQKHTYTCKSN